MKTIHISALASLFLSSVLFLNSCKKNDDVDPTKGLSAKIQTIVSQQDIDGLRSRGMIVNEGSQPPNIEGIFISSPHTLVSPYGTADSYKPGDTFSNLIIRFSEQSGSDQSAKVEIKTSGSTATGTGGFLSGNGNKFTFFAELDFVSGSVTGKQVRMFSGEITANGIKDFYTTIYFKSKNDPNNTQLPVGASRIIKDSDGLASKRSAFRMAADPNAVILVDHGDSEK